MKINIISHDNGVGLTQDIELITSLLKDHQINFVELGGHTSKVVRECPFADVNIFIELLNVFLFRFAKKNVLIPNPEWFWDRHLLKYIDLIIAKTRDAERLFKKMGSRTIFTSFTSKDKLLKNVEKEDIYMHFAGKSSAKGTKTVFRTWRDNPDLPTLIFGIYENNGIYTQKTSNIWKCFERVPEDDFNIIQNKSLFHVCTSEYEGFGHYIWEGMSCGAIIITTDAIPMKEFVAENGVLVPVKKRFRQNLGMMSVIDPEGLIQKVYETMSLSDKEREIMSKKSRKLWVENDQFFRDIFPKIFNKL